MNDVIVSMNIFHRDFDDVHLLNKNSIPILFYWDKNDNFEQKLIEDESFRKLIDEKCLNSKLYTNSIIGYTMLTINDSDEKWEDKYIEIQDLFTLDLLNDSENEFCNEYLNSIIYSLYEKAIGEQYVKSNILINENESYKEIFDKIREKYPNRFEKNTFIKYIHSELVKKYELHDTNIKWIINKLNNIFE